MFIFKHNKKHKTLKQNVDNGTKQNRATKTQNHAARVQADSCRQSCLRIVSKHSASWHCYIGSKNPIKRIENEQPFRLEGEIQREKKEEKEQDGERVRERGGAGRKIEQERRERSR